MLKANIGLELVDGFDELQKFFDGALTDRTMKEFERMAGILGKTVQNNAELAKSIVNASFNNATYSERIWMYQDMMKAELSKLLQQGLIAGRNPKQLAKHLQKLFGVRKSDAERLMRTELARVQTEAQKESFEQNGYDQYEFIALGNACEICKAIDGEAFDVKKMMPGENAPPMHPNCRCSVAAHMDREEFDKWLDEQIKVDNSGGNGIIKANTKTLKMNIQFFAEKDIKNQESNSLKRAIRKYNARIAEHKQKLENPELFYPEWNEYDPRYQQGLKRHWNKEIRNFNQSISDRIKELKERGDYDE